MSYSIKVSNTTNNTIELCYRMPRSLGSGLPITIPIQPRALLNEIFFPTEEAYHEMKKQNEIYFKKGYIIEGKTNEKEVVAKHTEVSSERYQNVKDKVDKATDDLQASADNINASLNIEVEKVSKPSRRGKK